jgi:thiol-disulfide isomerase/thioredoxin
MPQSKKPWTLKRILREVLLFAVIIFIVSTALNYYRAPELDSDTLPTIQATLIDGTAFDTATLKGKPLLINFWGTWCPVCAQEASNIEALSKRYTVLTIAVNSGSNEKIKAWMREKAVTYPVLNDASGRWARDFKVSIYPTIFIYDSKGQLKFTETGYSTTAGLLARMKLAE